MLRDARAHKHTHTHKYNPQVKAQKLFTCLCVHTHSLAQQEFIWWIWESPNCWEFVMFCLFMSIKSLVYAGVMYRGLCMWWSVSVSVSVVICFAFIFNNFASCFCFFFCFPISRKFIHPRIKCPVLRMVTLTAMTVTPCSFLCVASVFISGLWRCATCCWIMFFLLCDLKIKGVVRKRSHACLSLDQQKKKAARLQFVTDWVIHCTLSNIN